MFDKSILLTLSFYIFTSLTIQSQVTIYEHDLSGVQEQWHRLALDADILGKVKTDFSDIRIFAISQERDTLEVPYLMQKEERKIQHKAQRFELLNQVQKDGDFYFTFKLKKQASINEILLHFGNKNFNWLVDLEASQDQQEWFEVLSDYRILSIKNEITNYSFTQLSFPEAAYWYYRLKIKSGVPPENFKATLHTIDTIPGNYNVYTVAPKISMDKKLKKTILEIALPERLPVADLRIEVKDSFDYQRPLEIQYLSDSIQTEKGWKYYYKTIHRSYLSSLEKNRFDFNITFAKKLKLLISNHDNPPLDIGGVVLSAPRYQLLARFDHLDYKHFLHYGNPKKRSPKYDLVNFRHKVPKGAKAIGKGARRSFVFMPEEVVGLIENKWWLWGAMLVVIGLLAFFTVRMMGKVGE